MSAVYRYIWGVLLSIDWVLIFFMIIIGIAHT